MRAAPSIMRHKISPRVCDSSQCIKSFMVTLKQKASGVRPGEWGGEACGPPRPINFDSTNSSNVCAFRGLLWTQGQKDNGKILIRQLCNC
jgi:hypothetical protein